MGNVCIYEDSDQINTLSVKELLDSSGIITFIPNENMANILPVTGTGWGVYKILVPENQADRALEILKSHLFVEDEQTDENLFAPSQEIILNGEEISKSNICPHCGSSNILENTVKRILGFLFLGWARDFFMGDKPIKTCKDCDHQWI